MLSPIGLIKNRFLKYATELRFPKLAALTALLFFVDLGLPDFIPFADEILLGLVAALLATLKKGRRSKLDTAAASQATIESGRLDVDGSAAPRG